MSTPYWTLERLREMAEAGASCIRIIVDDPESLIAAMPFIDWWHDVETSSRVVGAEVHSDRGVIGDVRIDGRYVTVSVHSPIVVTQKAA